jgi:hypothetical protein
MEPQWLPASKDVQDTEVNKKGVGSCLVGQRCNFAIDYLKKGATIMAKYCVALLDRLKQEPVSKL